MSISDVQRVDIQPGYSISRVIKGGWQLAGGHGAVDENQAVEDMKNFVRSGITTFDCADIYTGVEELIGKFLHRYADGFRSGELPPVQVHTKCVPDLDQLPNLTPGPRGKHCGPFPAKAGRRAPGSGSVSLVGFQHTRV